VIRQYEIRRVAAKLASLGRGFPPSPKRASTLRMASSVLNIRKKSRGFYVRTEDALSSINPDTSLLAILECNTVIRINIGKGGKRGFVCAVDTLMVENCDSISPAFNNAQREI